MVANELLKLFGENKKITVKFDERFFGYDTMFEKNMMAEISNITKDSEDITDECIEITFDSTNYKEHNEHNAQYYNYETGECDLSYKDILKICNDKGYDYDLANIETRFYYYNAEIDFEVVSIEDLNS